MNEQLERLLTISEVAAYLRLSKAQVYAMVARKEIPCIRISERRIVVAETDLIKWLRKLRSQEPTQLVFMLDRILDE